MRYTIIKSVEIYSGYDKIGTIEYEDGLDYKIKLEDAFMSPTDICYVGEVLGWLGENGDIDIEEAANGSDAKS